MIKAIIGAGGATRELKAHMNIKNIKCFVDDKYYTDNNENIYPLSSFDPNIYEVVVCVGDVNDRFNIVNRLPKETKYFTYIHPSAILLDENIQIGEGSIICAGTVLTTNIKIGKHAYINIHSEIAHDCIIGDFFTASPGSKMLGHCEIGNKVYLGALSSIREKTKICNDVMIGLNSGVIKDIIEPGTYVGTPTKIIKTHKVEIYDNILECPECKHTFGVDDFSSGFCPNCKLFYYWDDDWDYINEECISPGFYWD